MGWFSDDDDDDEKETKSSSRSSPGPIGGHGSYGMDKETFDKSIGRDREREQKRADRDSNYGQPEKSVVDKVIDWSSEKVQDVSDWFSGKEDTGGFSPMGGPGSYGMSTQKFDESIGSRRHESRSLPERVGREVKYLQEAPLDYAADFLDNPLVSGAAAFSGFGMTVFGIRAMDAVTDYFQLEASPIQTVKSLGGQIVESTPVGQAFGPMRNVVASGIRDAETIAPNIAALGATSVGGEFAGSIAEVVTDNPYARAALTAGGAVGAGAFAKKAVREVQSQHKPSTGTPKVARVEPQRERRDRRESPLASSGEQAVAASRRLMAQPAPVDLYAQTVKQLPFYGLDMQQQQLPYYRA